MCKLEAVKKEFLFKGYRPKRKHKLRKVKQSTQLKSREKKQPETVDATLHGQNLCLGLVEWEKGAGTEELEQAGWGGLSASYM